MENISLLIQAISGAVTTIVTIFLALFTFLYVRLTKNMLDHMRASRSADLLIDLEFVSGTAYLVVRNGGGTPATEITFEVEDSVPWPHGSVQELDVVREGISYLPGGRTLKFWIGYLNWKEITPKKSLLKVKASYFADGIRNQREILIDLAQFRGTANEIPPEERIANAISRLADSQRSTQLSNRIFSFIQPTKACIECAENIKPEAKRCHFCGAVQPPNTDENVSPAETS